MTPPERRALLTAAVGSLVVSLYVFSFLFAQATPTPHELPVGLAGPAAQVDRAARRIDRAAGESFSVHRYRDEAAATRAIGRREVYGALVLGRRPARLLTASAAGLPAAMVVEEQLPRAAGLASAPAPVAQDVRALVHQDPQGVGVNLLVLPLVIFGFVVPVLLTTLAPALPVRRRMPVFALFAALGGLGTTLVANVWLDTLPGSSWAEAGLAALLLYALSAMTASFIAWRGPAGAGLAVLTFLVIGNVASGAQAPRELLPGFWRVVGGWLPPGAGADALRDTAYFGASAIGRPLLVLLAFAALGTAVSLAFGDRRPAPQGQPEGATADATAPAAAGT